MHILFTSILPIFVCTVGHFQSEFSFATVSVFQIGILRQHGWDSSPTLLRTLSPRRSQRDLPPQRRRRRRMPTPPPPQQQQQLRRWRRARAAMVFPACTRTSACWFLQCCAAWYVNAHLIPAISTEPHMHWHGVCRPKQHPITFSDSTPRCFGWNSSPSQCCASRSVLEHHISDIDMLYQPITLKCKIQ